MVPCSSTLWLAGWLQTLLDRQVVRWLQSLRYVMGILPFKQPETITSQRYGVKETDQSANLHHVGGAHYWRLSKSVVSNLKQMLILQLWNYFYNQNWEVEQRVKKRSHAAYRNGMGKIWSALNILHFHDPWTSWSRSSSRNTFYHSPMAISITFVLCHKLEKYPAHLLINTLPFLLLYFFLS